MNLSSGSFAASSARTFNASVTITGGTLGDWAGLVVSYK
jgi:hypothetical protein